MADEYRGQYNVTRKRWEPEIDGERHTLLEWSRIWGVSLELMMRRINRCGWEWEDAIITRPRRYRGNEGARERRMGLLEDGPEGGGEAEGEK